MFILNNAPTSDATIAMYNKEDGLRPTDPVTVGLLSEMKVSYDEMKRVAFALEYGSPRGSAHSAVIGGFSGGPNTAAIVAVAGGLMALTAGYGQYVRPGTVHNRIQSRACLPCIWTAALACEAFSRNSHVATDNGDHPAAGPGTKQYFYELAAYQIATVTAGAHSKGGTRKFVIGRTEDFGTPLESRWLGEICKASAGIKRDHANDIIKKLLQKYENKLMNAPEGYTFQQLYDLKRDEPREEYSRMYNEIRTEFEEMGLKFD
jgi:methylamine--corrinoid protein Co-methyltransferase